MRSRITLIVAHSDSRREASFSRHTATEGFSFIEGDLAGAGTFLRVPSYQFEEDAAYLLGVEEGVAAATSDLARLSDRYPNPHEISAPWMHVPV